jgi:hypothetical protein
LLSRCLGHLEDDWAKIRAIRPPKDAVIAYLPESRETCRIEGECWSQTPAGVTAELSPLGFPFAQVRAQADLKIQVHMTYETVERTDPTPEVTYWRGRCRDWLRSVPERLELIDSIDRMDKDMRR